ncbi:hypothetical protein CLOM_g1220 [Closterium sp. NIES-68]|nr:hypothetical protein CLOM_g1220 [Closterium sp. NIES-68]GJP71429.1 hypothetical protein CLOP_g2255 [Closterium sp. NIES-67]
MASVGPIKGRNHGLAANSYFTGVNIHGSTFRSAVLSGRLHSSLFPTTTISSSSSSLSCNTRISSSDPLSILPHSVLPLITRPSLLASHSSHSSSSSPSPFLSHLLPVAHCRAETVSDQSFQPRAYQALRTGSERGLPKERSNGKEGEGSDDDDGKSSADVSKAANVITERVNGKVYTVKLRSLYSAFCPRGMLIMAVRNSLIQILPLFADYLEAQAPSLEEEDEEEEEEAFEYGQSGGGVEGAYGELVARREARRERERRREVEAAERERKIAAFRSMDAGKVAAGTLWLSLREMAVITVRRALEHFYLVPSVSVRWLWKLTKDPTQSATRKVTRGVAGTRLITSVTVTNVRAHFLSPLSSVAVQLITDSFTAVTRLLFPPPPPPSSSLQAGQGLVISPVKATGVQIVWLVKRTLSYSIKLTLSTVSGALLSAVCVRYVGPWTTSYAYILGDMLVFQTASSLIDPLLFGAAAAKRPLGGSSGGGIGGASAGEGSTASTAAAGTAGGGGADFGAGSPFLATAAAGGAGKSRISTSH